MGHRLKWVGLGPPRPTHSYATGWGHSNTCWIQLVLIFLSKNCLLCQFFFYKYGVNNNKKKSLLCPSLDMALWCPEDLEVKYIIKNPLRLIHKQKWGERLTKTGSPYLISLYLWLWTLLPDMKLCWSVPLEENMNLAICTSSSPWSPLTLI